MKILKRTLSTLIAAIVAFSCIGAVNAFAVGSPGDLDSDGKVNSSDALFALKVATGQIKTTNEIIERGDLNLDGDVNSVDALIILNKTIGSQILVSSFELNTSDTTLKAGTEYQANVKKIIPKIADDMTVSWSSSDTSVASVDKDGKVTAIKAGKATIKATANDSGKVSSSFVVTVGAVAKTLKLNKTSLEMQQSKKYKLTATLTPTDAINTKLQWKSSNTRTATVDSNGVVTAKVIGPVTITCSTTDGSNLSASCDIHVSAMTIPYVSQLPNYPTGCEAASSCMLMKYHGFSITLKQMVDTIPRKNIYYKNGKKYGPDINEMFVGDPTQYYSSSTPGYGVFSPAVTKALQKAIDARGGGYKAVKMTGCTFDELLQKVSEGHPAIVWATYKMKNPTEVNSWYIDTTGKYFEYPRGTHVMILSGYSLYNVATVDPYGNGVQTYNIDVFESRWNLLGRQAIILEKN